MIQIDEEFKKRMPRLTDDEYSLLEENIINDGCRDPLVLWGDVIIDGHNRYQICCDYDIDFNTVQIQFADREEALDWIDKTQAGRRNLSPDQMSLIRGRRYNRKKKAAHGREGRTFSEDQNDPPKKQTTAEKLASEHGVSAPTIKRDGQFATNVEALKPFVPEIEQMVMAGETTKAAINEAAKEPAKAAEVLLHNHRAQGTGQNEWYTPQQYIEAARSVFGVIDVDPASSIKAQESIKATTFFTSDDNGLTQKWPGKVWLNPPYSQPLISEFISTLCEKFEEGETLEAILLTHNYTDTRWFNRAAEVCSAICFTKGRIGFLDPQGNKAAPTQGQAFFYFGEEVDIFKDNFSEFGFVVRVLR